MSDLQKIQQDFQDYLTRESGAINDHINTTEAAAAEHRLAVYHNAYRLRLIEALESNFPKLKKLLGEQQFDSLALTYIEQYPSRQHSLACFGDRFAHFLSVNEQLPHAAFCAELARFDWSRDRVFDAAESESYLDLDTMAQIAADTWPVLQFDFIPALRLEDFQWNAPEVATALDAAQEAPDLQRREHPVRWAIWRQNNDLRWRSLSVHEAWAVDQALQGESFAIVCEGLLEWIPVDTAALTAAGLVKQWISDQWITKLHQKG